MIRNLLSILVIALSFSAFAQPANDLCIDAQLIAMGGPEICIPTLGDNTGATGSAITPGCAQFQGGEVWFSIVVPSTGIVIVETSAEPGGITDTGMAVYSGDCNDLVLLDCDDDGSDLPGLFSKIELGCLTPGAQLHIAVWEYFGDSEGAFNICAYQPAPGCGDISFLNSTVLSFDEVEVTWNTLGTGNTFILEYGPDGFTPGDGTVISGVVCTDGPPVTISGLTNNTSYDVYVYEECGPGETNTLTNGFTTPAICPQPSNVTADSVSVDFLRIDWATLNAGATFTVEYGEQGFTVGTGTQISGITGTDGPTVDIPGLSIFTFYDFYVWEDCDGVNVSDTAMTTLNTAPGILTNDECEGAMILPVNGPNDCVPTVGFNDGATDSGVPHSCAFYQGGDVWFTFVAPSTGEVFVETSSAGGFTDGGLALYSGDCDGGLTEVACNDDGGDGLFSLIEAYDLNPGETYYAAVWEYGGDNEGAFNICVYAPPTCPTPQQFSFFVDSVSSTDAFIDWTEINIGATYFIEYGLDGFTPGTGMIATGIIGTDGPTVLLPGLDAATVYDYYFWAVCSPGDTTDVLGPYFMQTLETCQSSQIWELETDTTGFDFATISWPPYNPGATFVIEYGLEGFTPGTGTVITGIVGIDGPPVTLPGLLIGSDYELYLQEACDDEDSTQVAGPYVFETNSLPPAYDDLCNSAELLLNAPFAMFNNEGATAEAGEVNGLCFGGQPPLETAWFHFTAPAGGEATASTDLANTELHDTHIAVYELNGDCADLTNLTEIGCDEDGGDEGPSGFTSVAILTGLIEGNEYYIQVDGWDGLDGEFGIRVFADVVSVDEFYSDGFLLFPNPAAEQVTIQSGTMHGSVDIEILDMNGRRTYADRRTLEATRPVIIDVSSLDAGIYMIRVLNEDGFSVQRLIVE